MADAKHWVVTGASRGLGLEMVAQLLQTDEQVTALARNSTKARHLQELLLQYPARLRVLEADVTKDLDVDRTVKMLDGQCVDVLINNAGVFQKDDGALTKMDPGIIEYTFNVNALSPMRVTKAFLPLLLKSKHPMIANITSLMGSIADNSSGSYYGYRMSKAALNMFTKTLSVEFPSIIALSLHPGWVKTDMGGDQAPTERRESAAGLLKVIKGATPKDNGHFYNFKGASLPW